MGRTEDRNSIRDVIEAMETIKSYCATGECKECIFSRPSLLFKHDVRLCYFADYTAIPSDWELSELKEKYNA